MHYICNFVRFCFKKQQKHDIKQSQKKHLKIKKQRKHVLNFNKKHKTCFYIYGGVDVVVALIFRIVQNTDWVTELRSDWLIDWYCIHKSASDFSVLTVLCKDKAGSNPTASKQALM